MSLTKLIKGLSAGVCALGLVYSLYAMDNNIPNEEYVPVAGIMIVLGAVGAAYSKE